MGGTLGLHRRVNNPQAMDVAFRGSKPGECVRADRGEALLAARRLAGRTGLTGVSRSAWRFVGVL